MDRKYCGDLVSFWVAVGRIGYAIYQHMSQSIMTSIGERPWLGTGAEQEAPAYDTNDDTYILVSVVVQTTTINILPFQPLRLSNSD